MVSGDAVIETLRNGLCKYRIVSGANDPSDSVVGANRPTAARSFLQGLMTDCFNMMVMRRVLSDTGLKGNLNHINDVEVVDLLVRRIASGQLRILADSESTSSVAPMRGASEPPEQLEEPQSAPPPVAVAEPKRRSKENVATPRIDLEYRTVLLDKNLAQYQAAGETGILATPTYVVVQVEQSNENIPYEGTGKLLCNPANVDVYLDATCRRMLPGDLAAGAALTNAQLTGAQKLKLYLRGKTAGLFEISLTLDGSPGESVTVEQPALKTGKHKMGVVDLKMKVHAQDKAELDKIQVDPDLDPPPLAAPDDYEKRPEKYHPNLMGKYHKSLLDKALPDQVALTDEDKVKTGRLLHVQTNNSFGRAKLVCQKIDAAHWPDGTEEYEVCINQTCKSGNVAVYDAEWDGVARKLPLKIKLADLKAAEQVFWVEGQGGTASALDAKLDLALDRPVGKLTKRMKRNGDWARFTVVNIREVGIEYKQDPGKPLVWDRAKKRFYINQAATWNQGSKEFATDDKTDVKGRTIEISARLSEKIAGVTIHFMLVPDKNNLKSVNWGEDLPIGQKLGRKRTAGYQITKNDAGFSLDGADRLILTAGILDKNGKKEYSADVTVEYDDGSKHTVTKTVSAVLHHGFDTSLGAVVHTFGSDDFPTYQVQTWKWNKIATAVKHKDKVDHKNLLHISAVTDAEGIAKAELVLSRFGGDRFRPACYVDQDPHLAKYIHGYPGLGERKPVHGADEIKVWRRAWYQRVMVEGFGRPRFEGATRRYRPVKVELTGADDLEIKVKKVEKYNPQAIYERYMVEVNGGTGDALVVSDTNKAQFFDKFAHEEEKPNMIPVLVCDAQWDPDGDTAKKKVPWIDSKWFPYDITVGKDVLNPPLQGGDLYVSGTWVAREWDPVAGAWGPKSPPKNLTNNDLTINKDRDSIQKVTVKLPAALDATKRTVVQLDHLSVRGAAHFLGESSEQRILAVFDPGQPVDFQNTIAHEIGHAYAQVIEGDPAGGVDGIPFHPIQMNAEEAGNHCRYFKNLCVMYDSGPVKGSLNRYCEICHPYLLIQDMSKIK
jgi:hypothetical protein